MSSRTSGSGVWMSLKKMSKARVTPSLVEDEGPGRRRRQRATRAAETGAEGEERGAGGEDDEGEAGEVGGAEDRPGGDLVVEGEEDRGRGRRRGASDEGDEGEEGEVLLAAHDQPRARRGPERSAAGRLVAVGGLGVAVLGGEGGPRRIARRRRGARRGGGLVEGHLGAALAEAESKRASGTIRASTSPGSGDGGGPQLAREGGHLAEGPAGPPCRGHGGRRRRRPRSPPRRRG